jgi:hypothetical protein
VKVLYNSKRKVPQRNKGCGRNCGEFSRSIELAIFQKSGGELSIELALLVNIFTAAMKQKSSREIFVEERLAFSTQSLADTKPPSSLTEPRS